MAKTLVRRTCTPKTGYFEYKETYYNTAYRERELNPLEDEIGNSATCSIFNLDVNTVVDSYCVVVDGDGYKRTIYGNGTGANETRQVDTVTTDCSGFSDLLIQFYETTPTSSIEAEDGKISVGVSSSVPPLRVYIPSVGNKEAMATEATFEFTGLKKGTYTAYVTDGNDNQLTSQPMTVGAGAAPGFDPKFPGANVGSKVTWAKFEYIHNPKTGGGRGFLGGWAWNKTTKTGYAIDKLELQYPDFYQYNEKYQVGDVVRYTRKGEPYSAYFKAEVYMHGDMYQDNKRKLPYPDQNGEDKNYWQRIPLTEWTFDPNLKSYVKNSKGDNILKDYGVIEQGRIARYGYDCFYKARGYMESRNFPNNQLPKPTYKKSNQYWELLPDYTIFNYVIPEEEPIDEYYVGTLFRRVFFRLFNPDLPESEENRDKFYFVDVDTKTEAVAGDLRVIDIIKNDIDDKGAENGSAWILADSPSLPIRYHLVNPVRAGYAQDNQTGQFANLPAGSYKVDIRDAENRYIQAEFVIKDEYGLRWKLRFFDNKGVKLETRIYERDWTGSATSVIGSDDPVVLSWDSGGAKDGYLPESVGANLDFTVHTQVAQQFVDTILKDDRNHRVDHLRNDVLHFRGYLDATSYTEKMLGAGDTVTLTATDGLGALKSSKFLNHNNETQVGRTNLLSTLLSCLSRTDVNMPVICGVNLRDKLMAADGDPLQLAYGQRTAYNEKDTITSDEDQVDCRTVIDAILRTFNAFLYQKEGAWHIVSLNEAMDEFATRTWSSNGVLVASGTHTGNMRIQQYREATASNELYWINALQSRTTIAAAALITSTVNLQLEENLLKNGNFQVFASKRPLHWTVTGALNLDEASGEKAGEKAVRFSKYGDTVQNGSYLLSSAVPHLAGKEEEWMRLTLKAKLENTDDLLGDTEATANLYVQIVCDGQPFGFPKAFEISTKDKWKELKYDLPLGMPGTRVQVRVLQPQKVEGNSRLLVSSVALKIQPGAQEWNKSTTRYVVNPLSVTGIELPEVALVHADIPRLAGANSVPLEPKKMQIYAWRHGLSLADYTATSGWKRPSLPTYTPLQETAAQDRMLLRSTPTDEITGEVSGNGFDAVGVGTMLDLPSDGIDGKFIVISCFKHEKQRIAQITLRKLSPGIYGEARQNTPVNARIANVKGRKRYRVVLVNGVKKYRVANR